MLEALFTSWILREQRKSSHNSVSDNNRGGKINNYAYLFFLDLLLAWRAYKAAWCISSLLYLPDKKLCCPFLFFRTFDTLCDENWKVAKKFVFSNNFAVISNEFFETFWSKWLQFLKPFFYTFSFGKMTKMSYADNLERFIWKFFWAPLLAATYLLSFGPLRSHPRVEAASSKRTPAHGL